MGCVSQVGEQALNVARMSSLVAGWPETVCGTSIDRQCGSSMQAAFNAASAIQAGHLDVVVASGVESMSRVPMGSNLTANGFEGFSPKLYERWEVVPQGISAEVHRRRVGALARGPRRVLATSPTGARSPRSTRAASSGRSSRSRPAPGGAAVLVATDENPRRDTSLEKLASLKPAFKEDGKVTAGNSSAIVDGAAAMLVTSERGRVAARARAARALRVVRPRGRRPVPHAPRQPARVRARAREGRPRRGTTSP